MISKVVLIVLTASLFSITQAKFSKSCSENRQRANANLDSAIQLLEDVIDNYPTCKSGDLKCLPIDCEDILQSGQNDSGIYEVWPQSRVIKGPIEVYCDMDTDGGGWTVIQRRGNYGRPKDFFHQDWKSYKEGFGNIAEDFWLGNDNIFALSNQRDYSARFDLMDIEMNQGYALYDTFWIDDENHQYTLHIKGYSGNAGDSMQYLIGHLTGQIHNGQKFSTKDRDNDKDPQGSCSQKHKGGWWYDRCLAANLNGLYHRGVIDGGIPDGVIWYTWRGTYESFESTEIKIRSNGFRK